ncbi:MAG: hypothetical protein AAF915_24790 [Cyanobacteria bacterium P01_D01_bin.50]
MPKFTEKRYYCGTCRQQVLIRFETQQAIVGNPKACTKECAFGLMIVGVKDILDQEMFEMMKNCDW